MKLKQITTIICALNITAFAQAQDMYIFESIEVQQENEGTEVSKAEASQIDVNPQTNGFIHPNIAAEYCNEKKYSKQDIVSFINKVRISGITCNSTFYPPVGAVTWNEKLEIAAYRHSKDMAKNQFVEHKGTDGTLPDQRIDQAGYRWINLTENISSGTRSLGSTLDSFIVSEYHCNNLMDSKVEEMGMACAFNSQSDQGLYWTQLFASK